MEINNIHRVEFDSSFWSPSKCRNYLKHRFLVPRGRLSRKDNMMVYEIKPYVEESELEKNSIEFQGRPLVLYCKKKSEVPKESPVVKEPNFVPSEAD